MADNQPRPHDATDEPSLIRRRAEIGGQVMQPPQPLADLHQHRVGPHPRRPGIPVPDGLARQVAQHLAAGRVEAERPGRAREPHLLQVPQQRVHGRRPRRRPLVDHAIDQHSPGGVAARQRDFGHPSCVPAPSRRRHRLKRHALPARDGRCRHSRIMFQDTGGSTACRRPPSSSGSPGVFGPRGPATTASSPRPDRHPRSPRERRRAGTTATAHPRPAPPASPGPGWRGGGVAGTGAMPGYSPALSDRSAQNR